MKRLSTRLLKVLIVPVLILVLAAVAQADGAPRVSDGGGGGDGPHSIVNTSRSTPPIANSVLLAVGNPATDLQSQLLALGITTVDIWDTCTSTPTLAQLTPYDAVVSFPDCPYQDPLALGNNLADYVDGGGGVVLGAAVWFGGSFDLLGRIQDPGYSPFVSAGPFPFTPACLGTPVHQFPPIIAFVHTVCDGFRDDVAVEPDAFGLAWWDDGFPFVGVNHAGTVVGITAFPIDFPNNSGDVTQVFFNAINWVAQNVPNP